LLQKYEDDLINDMLITSVLNSNEANEFDEELISEFQGPPPCVQENPEMDARRCINSVPIIDPKSNQLSHKAVQN
jgi:hypothetical protein